VPKPRSKGLTRERIEQIVRKEAPGYRVAPERKQGTDRDQRYAPPDVTVPSIEATRKKYRERGPGADHAERRPVKTGKPGRVVKLEPELDNTDARRVAPKRIHLSPSGKVISRQG
jgi:hypothetical protein